MNWYNKQSITIRAAIIGGGFAILAGIITGIIDAAIPNPPIIIQYPPTGNETIIPEPALEQVPTPRTFDRAKYQELVDFAYNISGLNLATRADAGAWADANYEFFQQHDFVLFKEIFEFAYSVSGINMSTRVEAGQWALENVTFFETHEFDEFKGLFEYAYSATGLNMATRIQAANWALEKMGK